MPQHRGVETQYYQDFLPIHTTKVIYIESVCLFPIVIFSILTFVAPFELRTHFYYLHKKQTYYSTTRICHAHDTLPAV